MEEKIFIRSGEVCKGLPVGEKNYYRLKEFLHPAYLFAESDKSDGNRIKKRKHAVKIFFVKEILTLNNSFKNAGKGQYTVDKKGMRDVLHEHMKSHGSPLSESEAKILLEIKMRKEKLSKKDVFGKLTEKQVAKIPLGTMKLLAHNIELLGKLR